MALNLKNEVDELRSALDALVSLNIFEQAKQSENEQIKLIFETIQLKMQNVEREAEELDVAMSARDSTIRALGEKLSVLRMKHAKPFVVSANQDQKRDPTKDENPKQLKRQGSLWSSFTRSTRSQSLTRRKSLFRVGEETEWDKENTREHMKEMAEQIARLSLKPMGLTEAEMQDQIADIAATRLYGQKALNLIKSARAKGVEDKKIRAFLKKKGLPETTINRHFNQCSTEDFEVQTKSMPEVPSFPNLDATTRSGVSEVDYGSDSESTVNYTYAKGSVIFDDVPQVPCTPTHIHPAPSPRAGL